MMVSKAEKDPSAVVVPFGKHKGATVAELLAKDPQYADWVLAQGWVAERFAELHAAIATRGTGTDDTPEHNAIQVRFLDEAFRLAALLELRPSFLIETAQMRRRDFAWREAEALSTVKQQLNYSSIYTSKERIEALNREKAEAEAAFAEAVKRTVFLKTRVEFERRGIDVVIGWDFASAAGAVDHDLMAKCNIEIKPTMGDDFPSVMRQMQRLGSRDLVIGTYSGQGVSEPDLRRMFQANGMEVVSVRDIEAEIANARTILAEGLKP